MKRSGFGVVELGGREEIMTRAILVGASLACLAALTFAEPASKPDFTGTWTMDADRSESPKSSDSAGSISMVIKQSKDELSVETRKEGQTETLLYKMDGTETIQKAPENGPYRWRARWNGADLITEVTRNINSAAVTINEVHSLAASGKEMNVNRTLTVQHGYNSQNARNYASAKDVFVKAAEPVASR